jgi:hypothetical protein
VELRGLENVKEKKEMEKEGEGFKYLIFILWPLDHDATGASLGLASPNTRETCSGRKGGLIVEKTQPAGAGKLWWRRAAGLEASPHHSWQSPSITSPMDARWTWLQWMNAHLRQGRLVEQDESLPSAELSKAGGREALSA